MKEHRIVTTIFFEERVALCVVRQSRDSKLFIDGYFHCPSRVSRSWRLAACFGSATSILADTSFSDVSSSMAVDDAKLIVSSANSVRGSLVDKLQKLFFMTGKIILLVSRRKN